MTGGNTRGRFRRAGSQRGRRRWGRIDVARAHYDDTGRCLYTDVRDAELADDARIILATGHAVALAPFAPRAPYETCLMPRVHHASFADAPDAVLADIAALLRRLLAALRRLLGDVAYNYLLISAPCCPI